MTEEAGVGEVTVVAGAEARGGEGWRPDVGDPTVRDRTRVRLLSVPGSPADGDGAPVDSDVVRWRRDEDFECFDDAADEEDDDDRCDFDDVLPLLCTSEDLRSLELTECPFTVLELK